MLILSFSNIKLLLKSTLFPGEGGDGKLLVWYYLLHYQLNFICNEKNTISAIGFRKFSIYYEHDCLKKWFFWKKESMDKMYSSFFKYALNMILNSFPGVIGSLIPFFIIFRAFLKKLEHILTILSFFQKIIFSDKHVHNILRIFEIQ